MPPTKRASLAEILGELRNARSFLIASHEAPDGDAVGSVLTMAHFLRAMGKTAITCMLSDPVPRIYQWLPGANWIVGPEADLPPVDVAVILDVARRDRFEAVAKRLGPDVKLIVIDHHVEDAPCGDLNLVDPGYAAVGEILVELFAEAEIPLTREAAECAYVAQITDTGGYRFSNTNSRSHRIAARLLETGLDAAGISQRVFDVVSLPKMELLERVLTRRMVDMRGRVAYSYLNRQDMAEAGARDEDAENLVNYMRNMEGVEVGILFRELDAATTKVSVRSRDAFDAAAFLQRFGGGGHRAAAGATVAMPLDETRARVLDALPRALENTP